MRGIRDAQIETALADQIQQLYETQLGHLPHKVTCQVFEGKLAVILEDALTQPERMLLAQGQIVLVRQVRDCLNEILQTRIKALITELVGVAVSDLLIATQLDTGLVSIMAILVEDPCSAAEPMNSTPSPVKLSSGRIPNADVGNVAP
jgi:uncharacterized protein YbcI